MAEEDTTSEGLLEFDLVRHSRRPRGVPEDAMAMMAARTRSPRHDAAPDVPLRAPDGTAHSLQEFKGQNVVLHIFDRDELTAGRHARSLQAHLEEFRALNAQVVGVAPAGLRAQRRFARSNRLDFMLLCDRDRELMTRLAAKGNATIVIDADGRVDKVYSGRGRADRETERVIRHLRALQQEKDWAPSGAPPS